MIALVPPAPLPIAVALASGGQPPADASRFLAALDPTATTRVLPSPHPRHYSAPVTVSPVAGRRGPIQQTAHQRPKTIAGAFFVPAMSCHGGCAWEGFGPAGSRLPRSANPRAVATSYRVAAVGGGSNQANGAVPMRHIPARSPSTASTRAAAHRAMALAALRADSSLSVRLKRYNEHMTKARALDAQDVAK